MPPVQCHFLIVIHNSIGRCEIQYSKLRRPSQKEKYYALTSRELYQIEADGFLKICVCCKPEGCSTEDLSRTDPLSGLSLECCVPNALHCELSHHCNRPQ